MNQESLILNENDTQSINRQEQHIASTLSSSSVDDIKKSDDFVRGPLEEPLLESENNEEDDWRGLPSVGKARILSDKERVNTKAFGNKQLKFIRVTAPLTMPSDTSFVARLADGRVFEVTVPDGGVIKGQEFNVFYPRRFLNPTVIPPYGKWKDHIFSCFNLAICHSTIWTTILFPLVALAHVLTRLRLTCCGTQTTKRGAKSTFPILLFYTVTLIGYMMLAIAAGLHFRLLKNPKYAAALMIPLALYILYIILLTMRARNVVRHRYNIHPSYDKNFCIKCCRKEENIPICSEEEIEIFKKYTGICEDITCGLCCTHCTICQLSRQTADYLSYDGTILRRNGLPKHSPCI